METRWLPSILSCSVLALSSATPTQSWAAEEDEAPEEKSHRLAPDNHMFELGAWLGLYFPSGRHELYDPQVGTYEKLNAIAPDLGLRAGYFPIPYVGVELEGGVSPTSTRDTASGATIWKVRGHLVGQLPIGRFAPFAVLGYGGLFSSSDDTALGSDADGAFHWGLGAKMYLTKLLALRLDGRHLVSGGVDDPGQPNSNPSGNHFELLAGLSFTLGRPHVDEPDPDGDGIRGEQDQCPDQEGVAPTGCPAKDGDGDGVMDHLDDCPIDPGRGKDGCPLEDQDGDGIPDVEDKCPTDPARTRDGCPSDDRDEDGITNDRDQCPEDPGPEPHGCPDSDGDGISDSEDQCKDVAGVAPAGCPPQDTDDDGVTDDLDQCPAEAETPNGFEDDDGCPDEGPTE